MPTGIPVSAETAGALFALAGKCPRMESQLVCLFPCRRHFFSKLLARIERIELAPSHRVGRAAGPEIIGSHVRLNREDLDGKPATPSAVAAAIWLTIGQPVTEGFEETPQARRIEAGRIT